MLFLGTVLCTLYLSFALLPPCPHVHHQLFKLFDAERRTVFHSRLFLARFNFYLNPHLVYYIPIMVAGYKHWAKDELVRFEGVATCAEMFLVAKSILERMPAPISQVCGPISTGGAGTAEGNITIMARAIEHLEERGHNVFNQLPFQKAMFEMINSRKEASYPMYILEDFYLPIFESGLVKLFHFLPDWQSSTGAKWEHAQAKRLGIEIKYFEDDWQTAK